MSLAPRILAFAGSARVESHNKRLARAAAQLAQHAGASTTWIDLRDFELPLYCADLEAHHGLPPEALRLRALFDSHDALIVASPEYNGFFSPLLKNTLDWLSRPYGGAPRHAVFAGKGVLLLSAAVGSGGSRGLQQLRLQFEHLKSVVHEQHYLLTQCGTAFDADGRLGAIERRDALAQSVAAFLDQLPQRQPQAA